MRRDSNKTKGLRISGLLMLLSVALLIVFAVLLLNRTLPSSVTDQIMLIAWFIGPLLIFGVALAFTNHEFLGNVYAVLFLLSIFAAIIGGVFALRGKNRRWALVGAIGSILTAPPLGIAAMALMLSSRK